MLSHLRFHRRDRSTPTSPLPDQISPWEQHGSDYTSSTQEIPLRPDFTPRASTVANTTSSFQPPLHRVSAVEHDATTRAPHAQAQTQGQTPGPSHQRSSSFMGGVALRNYQSLQHQARPMSAGRQVVPSPLDLSAVAAKPQLSPALRSADTGRLPPTSSDMESRITSPGAAKHGLPTGKRPPGARLPTEPALGLTSPLSAQSTAEAQRSKKGLPFLKHPMSTLLMRRRTGQFGAPEIAPLPLAEVAVEQTYDPRIRGTRVHDFSAPRPPPTTRRPRLAPVTGPAAVEASQIPATAKLRDAVEGTDDQQTPRDIVTGSFDYMPRKQSRDDDSESTVSVDEFQRWRDVAATSPEDERRPHKPNGKSKDLRDSTASFEPASAARERRKSGATMSSVSLRSQKSFTPSIPDASARNSFASAVPRHMKSTSSRFSFDMVGAARAEKLLEEKHRQRELEKLTTGDPMKDPNRDSLLDDFDEDAMYTAMMDGDEDDLEEAIPEVNDDYDEAEDEGVDEEDEEREEREATDQAEIEPSLAGGTKESAEGDPDNDQQNFAGFIFSRSEPTSRITSPKLLHQPSILEAPRDANGHPIGFAHTSDELPISPTPYDAANPEYDDGVPQAEARSAGLGIRGVDGFPTYQYDPTVFQERRQLSKGHLEQGRQEMYLDPELADELQAGPTEDSPGVFDESIFDNDDTDQYGRPIPGAFAQAQVSRAAQPRHESGVTSHVSRHSAASASTAHTSLSVGMPFQSPELDKNRDIGGDAILESIETQEVLTAEAKIAAYQAALAEAARNAAEEGKFRRSSSPTSPVELAMASLNVTVDPVGQKPQHEMAHGYHEKEEAPEEEDGLDDLDGYETTGFEDDYDLDDDALIAEANANALAYDADGFYGQEFGFYSAPETQGRQITSAAARNKSNPQSDGNHDDDNSFEYFNGGYFGPSGVVRSKSGKTVCREPNLTPITERSEYSNRNSILGLGLPPGGPFSLEGRNSAPLHSPGLAQLVMMADESDLGLQALMRLRTKAWGGSQGSGVNSREGSPRAESQLAPVEAARPKTAGGVLQPPPQIIPGMSFAGHGRKGPSIPKWSSEAGSSPIGESPTLSKSMALPTIGVATNADFSGSALMSSPSILQQQYQQQNSPRLRMGDRSSSSSTHATSTHAKNTALLHRITTSHSSDSSPISPYHIPRAPHNSAPTSAPPLSSNSSFSPTFTFPTGDSGSTGTTQHHHTRTDSSGHTNSYSKTHRKSLSASPSRSSRSSRPGTGISGTSGTSGIANQALNRGHKHNSSADSISYMMEPGDDGGEARWVMERRRTGDGGEVEILEREVLRGGRI